MLLITPIAIAVFVLLSRGGRRVGLELLGVAGIGICLCPILAGVSVWELEPNFGPYTTTLSVLLVLMGLICGVAGALSVKRIGIWLGRPDSERRISTRLLPVGLALGLGLTVVATLHARGRAPAAPDALPLMTIADNHSYGVPFEAGGIRVVSELRKLNPTSVLPDACFMVVTDKTAGKDYEVEIAEVKSGGVEVLSGMVWCPSTITIDPTRRIVYLSSSTLFSSTSRAWKLPGFQPTSTTVWTCRRGRLLAAPHAWIGAAWLGLGIAALGGLARAVTARASAGRLVTAREAVHEGSGVLSLSDGTRLTSIRARDLPVGPVVLLDGTGDATSPYRSSSALHDGVVIPATLLELAEPSTRRACFASLLGILALGLTLGPLLLGVTAALIDLEQWRRRVNDSVRESPLVHQHLDLPRRPSRGELASGEKRNSLKPRRVSIAT